MPSLGCNEKPISFIYDVLKNTQFIWWKRDVKANDQEVSKAFRCIQCVFVLSTKCRFITMAKTGVNRQREREREQKECFKRNGIYRII